MINRITLVDLVAGIGLLALLIGTAFMQTRLKDNPQIVMLAFGGLLLLIQTIKRDKIGAILFYMLLGIMLFVNYFMLTDCVLDIVLPNRGWVEIDGIRRPVIDTIWILGIFVGLLMTPLTLLLYYKKVKRNKPIEVIFVILFVLNTAVVYYI